jgi:hypothetical protein
MYPRDPLLCRNREDYMPGRLTKKNMSRCEHCGSECSLPFTCQHCRGSFCPDCRLPPNHNCTGLGSWNRKPRPTVSVNYGKGGSVSVTGGGDVRDSHSNAKKRSDFGIPYLKIIIAIIVLVLIGLVWLMLSGLQIR